jgi:monoamine oxidase
MMVESRARDEWAGAAEFARNNALVAQAAGGIKSIYPQELARRDGTVRYLLSVSGEKEITAVLTVSRAWTTTQFALQCITYLPPGKRDSSKDVCEQ